MKMHQMHVNKMRPIKAHEMSRKQIEFINIKDLASSDRAEFSTRVQPRWQRPPQEQAFCTWNARSPATSKNS